MRRRKPSFILTALFLLFIAGSALSEVGYQIKLKLDPKGGGTTAEEEISFRNNTGKAISELTIRLGPVEGKNIEITGITDEKGATLSISEASLPQISEKKARFFRIVLSSPIPPQGSSAIKLRFRITGITIDKPIILPDSSEGGRPCWYPRLVSSNDPWYRERADYSVQVTTPVGYTTISSGEVEADIPSEVDTSGEVETTLSGEDIRGFALIIGRGLETSATTTGGVRITLYFSKGRGNIAVRTGAVASDIISYYKSNLGFFPGEKIDLVLIPERDLGGNEAPGIIILNDSLDSLIAEYGIDFAFSVLRFELSYLLAREYFGEWLADPGNQIPWLTHGLALFASERYTRSVRTYLPTYRNYLDYYLTAAEQDINTNLSLPMTEIKKEITDWQDVLARGKGYAVISMLSYLMGEEKVWELARKLLERFPISPPDYDRVVALASEVGERDFSSFFAQWVRGNDLLDYAIERGETVKSGDLWKGTVEILRIGEAIMPLKLTILLTDGEIIELKAAGKEKREKITFEAKAMPRRAEIDRERLLPDIDRRNNYFFFGSTSRPGGALFPIDRLLDIGELELSRDFKKQEGYLQDEFTLRIANKTDEEITLGLLILGGFPGLRTKGKRAIVIALPARGKRTINDYYFIRSGKGRARVEANFFLISNEEEFNEKIKKRAKPDLSLNYAVVIN